MNVHFKTAIVLVAILALGIFVVLKKGGASFCCPHGHPPHSTPSDNAPVVQPRIYDNPSGLPRLVELGSTTCIPCQIMKPIIDELTVDYAGTLDVLFVDVNTDNATAKTYAIEMIPTQVFVDPSGKELFRNVGIMSKEDILAKWAELGFLMNADEPVEQAANNQSL